MPLPELHAPLFVGLVLVVLFVAFVREWVKPDVAVMVAVGVLLVAGMLNTKEVLGVFGNSAPITIDAGSVFSGSRISPLTFVTSAQPS